MRDVRYLSLFSGIEAASVAWHHLGWTPVGFAEIEPFPARVLEHQFPGVPNHGDVQRIPWQSLGRVDVLVGGFPCQSFSVAGKRGGLSDPRGSLAMTFVEAAHATGARFAVGENVPGLLTAKDNSFGHFLGALVGADAPIRRPGGLKSWPGAGLCSGPLGRAAWRILDAQFFGVPQRRRRVFVVFCPGANGGDPAAVLFEPAGVCRDSEASRSAREEVAGTLGGGAGSRGWADDTDRMTFVPTLAPTVTAKAAKGSGGPSGDESQNLVAFSCKNSGADAGDTSPTLRAMNHVDARANGGGQVAVAVAFDTTQITRAGNYSAPRPGDPCHPIAAGAHPPAIACQCHGGSVGPLGTLKTGDNHTSGVPFVTHPLRGDSHDAGEDGAGRGTPIVPAIVGTLSPGAHPGGANGQDAYTGHLIPNQARVRRLTPRECERLQGFPDDWTLIPGAKDGPRYRAIGNSMAVPVMRWIGERIAMQLSAPPAAGEATA